MRAITIPKFRFSKIKADVKGSLTELTKGGFQQIFSRIDQLGIKKGVDQMGLDKFINQCALMAAGSGVITGAGGISTILIGVPVDMINLITQQFRVTLAVSYAQTGTYQFRFEDFLKVVATSLRADAGVTITKNLMEDIAQKLMINIGSKTAERLIPIVGAVIGGSANYFFIKRIAASVKNGPAV